MTFRVRNLLRLPLLVLYCDCECRLTFILALAGVDRALAKRALHQLERHVRSVAPQTDCGNPLGKGYDPLFF
jgi:hypothetical protein